MDNDILTYF